MKKIVLAAILTFVTVFTFADPPFGCYEGSSRYSRGRCAIQVGGGDINVIGSDGTVIARWKIVSDNNGEMTVRSEAGVTKTASWWREDGEVYINFGYETYKHL